MSNLREEQATREYAEPIEVTCAGCGATKQLKPKQRNNERFTGLYCDGVYGKRHPALMMRGPEGQAWA